MFTVYETEGLPIAERFDRMEQALRYQVDTPMVVDGPRSVDVRASLRAASFGEVSVSVLDSASDQRLELRRDRRLVRQSDPEALRIIMMRKGALAFELPDRQLRLSQRDWTLFSTSDPFSSRRAGRLAPCAAVMVTVPRGVLPASACRAYPFVDLPMPCSGELWTTVAETCSSLASRTAAFEQLPAGEVSELLCEMVIAIVQNREYRHASTLRDRARLTMARAVVVDNLSDPSLSPAAIAKDLSLSDRTLYRVAGHFGTTPSEQIRLLRCEAVHSDLADPAASLSIADLGARRGFKSQAQLTRTFKERYGRTPGQVRGSQTRNSDGGAV